jgi:hypothetical protein
MMNLSNVTHTCVCGTSNEKASYTTASMVETETDASIDVEGILYRCSNCKTSYNKILK